MRGGGLRRLQTNLGGGFKYFCGPEGFLCNEMFIFAFSFGEVWIGARGEFFCGPEGFLRTPRAFFVTKCLFSRFLLERPGSAPEGSFSGGSAGLV